MSFLRRAQLRFVFVWILLVTLSGLLSAKTSFASQAAVRNYDNPELNIGQSFLASYGEKCIAFMPGHVAREANNRPSFLKEGKQPILGTSQHLVDLGDDASMGFVQGEIAQKCGSSTSLISRAVDTHVQKSGLATLRWINFDGSQGNIAVSVLDHGDPVFLRIQPANSQQQIRKGMSGSVLWANGHPVGILLSVNAARGRATVFRMDELLTRAEAELRGNIGTDYTNKNLSENTSTSSAPDNLLAVAQGAAVTAWSAMAVSADKQAVNLLDPASNQGWQVAVQRFPVSVEFNLVGEKQALSRIVLSGEHVTDVSSLPKRATVMFNLSSSGKNWRTFSTVDLNFENSRKIEIRFPATWVRDLRLDLFGSNDQKYIELSRVFGFAK